MIPELPGSSREEADVTTPSQEGRPEEAWAVPARLAWQAFDEAYWRYEKENPSHRAFWTDHHQFALDAALRVGFAALAAVVVSSPATPTGLGDCEKCGHFQDWATASHCESCGWPDEERMRWRREFDAIPASPATPNGQEGRCVDSMCTLGNTNHAMHYDGRDTATWENYGYVAPAPPADTREGRNARVDWLLDYEWEPDRLPELYSNHRSHRFHYLCAICAGDVGRIVDALAASPAAVPLPEETEERTMSELPKTPGSVIYWLGSFAHLREDGRWVDDNGDSTKPKMIRRYTYPELYVVWDAHSWTPPAPSLPGEQPGGQR